MKRVRELSVRELKKRLKEHYVVSTGPRPLLEWRVQQIESGNTVRRCKDYRFANVPTFTYVSHHHEQRSNLFHCVPLGVINQHILCYLEDEPEALFSLMFTSRYFQAICHKKLHATAIRLFGPNGTPKIFSFRIQYDDNHGWVITRMCRLLGIRYNKQKYDDGTSFETLIEACIQRHGFIDNIPLAIAHKAEQKLAEEAEQTFIKEHASFRLKELNDTFKVRGYPSLFLHDGCHIVVQTVENAIELIPNMQVGKFKARLHDYVYMNGDVTMSSIVNFVPQSFGFIFELCCKQLCIQNITPRIRDVVRTLTEPFHDTDFSEMFDVKLTREQKTYWVNAVIDEVMNNIRILDEKCLHEILVLWYLDGVRIIPVECYPIKDSLHRIESNLKARGLITRHILCCWWAPFRNYHHFFPHKTLFVMENKKV